MNEVQQLSPKILHTSEGLTIKVNPRNRFTIASLHFTADPRKRSETWKSEAKAGMRQSDWEQEYEMSYSAHSGERVFPEIIENRARIVVGEPYPEFPPDQTYWGGMDYGARNPASLHYYTIYDGVIYVVWELYEPCRDVKDWVEKARSFPFYPRVQYIAADPTIFNKITRNSQGLPCSPYELLVKAGFSKLIKGDNDEAVWLMQMRDLWRDPQDPKLRIFSSCNAMVGEFENAMFRSVGEKASLDHNQYETLVDRNNHAMDDCKYFLSTRPKASVFTQVRWPRLVDKYVILK